MSTASSLFSLSRQASCHAHAAWTAGVPSARLRWAVSVPGTWSADATSGYARCTCTVLCSTDNAPVCTCSVLELAEERQTGEESATQPGRRHWGKGRAFFSMPGVVRALPTLQTPRLFLCWQPRQKSKLRSLPVNAGERAKPPASGGFLTDNKQRAGCLTPAENRLHVPKSRMIVTTLGVVSHPGDCGRIWPLRVEQCHVLLEEGSL